MFLFKNLSTSYMTETDNKQFLLHFVRFTALSNIQISMYVYISKGPVLKHVILSGLINRYFMWHQYINI